MLFGSMIGVILNVKQGVELMEAEKKFHEMLKTLPPVEAAAIASERKRYQEMDAQHQRNLEVARASRPLNFWGNR